jgi:hypothetical protein
MANIKNCKTCNKEFTQTKGNKSYCSDKCAPSYKTSYKRKDTLSDIMIEIYIAHNFK